MAVTPSTQANRAQVWRPFLGDLWKNEAGDLGFRVTPYTEHGEGKTYFLTHLAGNEKPLKDAIDEKTLERLSDTYYRDKNHIFHYLSMAGGGTFYVHDKIDPSSFRVMGCYARDDHAIYTDRGREVMGADLDTFYTTPEAGCFAKDKNGYFFWGERINLDDELNDVTKAALKELGSIH